MSEEKIQYCLLCKNNFVDNEDKEGHKNGDFIIKCKHCNTMWHGVCKKEFSQKSDQCPECHKFHSKYKVDYIYSKYYEKVSKTEKCLFY